MDHRTFLLPIAAAIFFLEGVLRPAAASVVHSEVGAGPLAQPRDGGRPALEFRGVEPRYPKPAIRRQQLFAHAIIVRTSPEQGAVAPENIGKVDVWYDAGIRGEFVALAVINAAGDRVDKHDAAIDTFDPSHVSTSVDPLTPGEYTVRYRAISADGHQVSGAWVFEVNGH